ncbi:MAG: hypothetical protein AB1403_10800 [Candidatus Riflebacteria bacterium]
MNKSKSDKESNKPEIPEEDLRKLLAQVWKRNPEYLDRLRTTIHKIASRFPADQWCGKREWEEEDLNNIFDLVLARLLKGNLIRFWVTSKVDSCVLKISLSNLVLKMVYELAPERGKKFHSQVPDDLKRNAEFIKESLTGKHHSHHGIRIGLKTWKNRKMTSHSELELQDLWRKNVNLPDYTDPVKLRPAQRADIFRQMLETADGWVEARIFYQGYRKLTGFYFNSQIPFSRASADTGESETGGDFLDYLNLEYKSIDTDVKEEIRQSIVESFDSWQPRIREALDRNPQVREFLRCYFLEPELGKGGAAEKVNKSPSWASETLKSFFESVSRDFSFKDATTEQDQLAFVQLFLSELENDHSGENQP